MSRALVVALWAIVAAQSAAMLVLALTSAGPAVEIDQFYAFVPLAFTTVGALIAFRRPANAIAWLLVSAGIFVGFESLANFVGVAALRSGTSAIATPAAWSAQWMWVPAFTSIGLALLIFPDGRGLDRRWSRLAVAVPPALAALAAVVAAFAPDPSFFRPEALAGAPAGPRAEGALGDAVRLMAPAVPLLIRATLVSAVVSLVARFRAGTRLERDQVKWIAYATGLLLASFIN